MNQSQYPIDEELVLFEKELKSLTPASFVLANPMPTQLPTTAPDAMKQRVTLPITNDPVWTSPTGNRTWLRTVAISWSAGLAAGLLISMFWTRWTSNEIASEVAQPQFKDRLSEPNRASSPLRESPLVSPPNYSLQTQEGADSRFESFSNANYFTAFESNDHSILRPMMSQRSIGREAAFVGAKSRRDVAGSPSVDDLRGNLAPSSSSIRNLVPIPFEQPRSQGQRQWLKSLMESEEFGSDSTT